MAKPMKPKPPQGEEWKTFEALGGLEPPEAFASDMEAARARIRKHRMAEAEILVLGPEDKPISGLEVEIEQISSPFLWGEQLWELETLLRHGLGQSDRVRHFTHLFTECLTSATCLSYWTEAPRNDGPKHMEFQGEDRLDGLAAQVEWALTNTLTPKGHPLLWPIPKAWPSWLARYPWPTQWKFAEVRVRNLVARFRGKVRLWDVVNEPLWEPAPQNLPQRCWPHLEPIAILSDYIAEVIGWAREEDPDAILLLNEYGLESDPPGGPPRDREGRAVTARLQRERYVELARRLVERGAAPDALGMQAHTGGWLAPAEQLAVLDELALAGLPLHYTEFWARADHLLAAGMAPEEAEARRVDYVERFVTVAFSHPAVKAFSFWGDLVEAFGFHSDANSLGLPTSSHEPNELYHRIRHLLRKEWRTRFQTVTGPQGQLRFRGFHGEYRLRHRRGVSLAFTLGPEGPWPARLRLPG